MSRLDDVIVAAATAVEIHDSTRDQEPAFLAVADYIEAHPECHDEIEGLALASLGFKPQLPWELLEFLLHRFRWPRVQEEILTRLSSSIPTTQRLYLESLLDSLTDDWEDRDLFPSLQKVHRS